MTPAPDRELTSAMIAFGTLLRTVGLRVTTGELMDAVRALEAVDLLDRGAVYLALRAVLTSRVEEQPAFDRCFVEFWRYRTDPWPGLTARLEESRENEPEAGSPVEDSGGGPRRQAEVALEGWEDDAAGGEPSYDLPGRSEREVLMQRDFSSFDAEDLDEVARLTALIARRLAKRVSRRRRPTRRRGRVDLRRTMRANLVRGELIELRRRARRRTRLRLVLLCDVSGSMDLYSRFLLLFVYALQNVFGRVETFTFATRLTRVTQFLRQPGYRAALAHLEAVRDWSGGTRIGASLREFNRRWETSVDRRTVVVLLSDGWDTGDPELLARELLAVKRRAGRVIWLNPLLGNPEYEPLTRGMAAALPLVDRFSAAHNLASLREFAKHLATG